MEEDCGSGGCRGNCDSGGSCGEGACGSGGCGCESSHGHGHGNSYGLADYFLEKTNDAWMQLFMEKLKKRWNDVDGKEMDKVVELLIKTAESRGKMDKKALNEALEKLMEG